MCPWVIGKLKRREEGSGVDFFDVVDEVGQFGDRAVDVVTLALELGDMRAAFLGHPREKGDLGDRGEIAW